MSLGHPSTIESNQGYVDSKNSSTTNLTAATSLTYTGTWFDCTDYSEMTVLVNTDQAGTLLIQSSIDTTVVDATRTIIVAGGVPAIESLAVISKYMRVSYTADADTSTFRIQSIFHKYKSRETVISGEQADGTYGTAKLDSVAFSTTANLDPAENFSSGILDLRGFTQVQTHVLSNVDGTVLVYFYSDAAGTDAVRTLTVPYTGGSGFQLFSAPAFSDYVKYDFLNGGTITADFYYETKFLTKALSAQVLGVESFIATGMTSALSRSVIVGKKPNGIYTNVNSDYNGDLKVSIGQNNRSAFGELNVAQLTPIVQEMFTYNINSRLINTTLVNTGTVTQANAMAVVGSGTTTASSATLQTRKRARYRPGIGLVCRFTALFTTGVADTFQYAGCFDEEDGFAFGYNGTSFGILQRSTASGSTVDTWTAQTAWNRDNADGTGTLPVLDQTKGNIFEIQLQYLGFGAIRFYIEDTPGEFILVHDIEYANANTQPSLANPSLPYSMFVDNNTTTSDMVMKTGSCGLFIEGTEKPHGALNSIENSKSGIGSTETNVLTIQNRTSYNSLTNHNLVYPYFLSIATIAGTKPTTIYLTLNSSIGGTPAFTNIDVNNSIVAYDTSGTTLTGGIRLASFILGKEDKIEINLKEIEEIFLEPGDELTISAVTPTGTVEVFTSITFLEDL